MFNLITIVFPINDVIIVTIPFAILSTFIIRKPFIMAVFCFFNIICCKEYILIIDFIPFT